MAARLYRLMLSSSTHTHLVSILQIRCLTLLEAERRATRLLRFRQITQPEGMAWDRWDLGSKPAKDAHWVHVASGTNHGTTSTTRVITAKDQRRGRE